MQDPKLIKRKTVSGVISYTMRTGFLYVISIVATGLLGVYLSPAEFGTYFIVTALIGLFTFMSDIGLAATLIQKKEEPTIEELRTTFTVQQILAFIIITIMILLIPLWKVYANLDRLGIELLIALSFSFLLASFKTIPSILLERKLEFGKLVMPQVAESVLFYGLAVWFAAQGYGIRSYTIAVIARSIVGVIVIYMLQRWALGFAFSKKTFKTLISFGAKFQLNDLLARIKDDLIIAVLARFLPASQMGMIGWAKRWSMFPYQFSVNSVVSIAFPTFSRLQSDPERLKRALEKALFFISLLIFPLLTGMVLMAQPLTFLIPTYQKWQPALPSLMFFCLNIAFAAIANPIINTLNAIGKINKTLRLMSFMTVMTWILTPISIYYFGMVGVSMAAAVVAFASLGSVFMIRSYARINFIDTIWRQLLGSAVMGIFIFVFYDRWSLSWNWLIAGIGLGGLVYVMTLLLVGFKKLKYETVSLFSR